MQGEVFNDSTVAPSGAADQLRLYLRTEGQRGIATHGDDNAKRNLNHLGI